MDLRIKRQFLATLRLTGSGTRKFGQIGKSKRALTGGTAFENVCPNASLGVQKFMHCCGEQAPTRALAAYLGLYAENSPVQSNPRCWASFRNVGW